MIAVDLGGGRKLWRDDAGFIISRGKNAYGPSCVRASCVGLHTVCVCVCVVIASYHPYVVCLQLRLKIGMQNCKQTPIHKHMVRHGKLLCRTLLTYLCPHDGMGLCGVLSKRLNGSRSQLFQTEPPSRDS